jgi:hypothetical protein
LADAIRIKETMILKHQANLGEDVGDVEIEGGTELTVLQEFDTAWLVKNDDGQLFNIKKEQAEEA